MAVTHPRTAIRIYTWDLIRAEVDVNNRVFMSKPNPVILRQLPCICVYFSGESVDIVAGDKYIARTYERRIDMTVDILAEQPVDPDKTLKIEDRLDELGREVELAIFDDVFYQKRLPGYNDSITDPGLISGAVLLSVTPYSLRDEAAEINAAAQQIVFSLPYEDDAFVEHKASIIESYLMEIRRVGWDETTVDPVLIAGEGDFS